MQWLSSLALLAAAAAAVSVHAWGEVGHHIVARIARAQLSPPAAAVFDALLLVSRKNQPWSIEAASTWADGVAHAKGDAWKWSKSLHYIDAGEGTADTCGVRMDRDCHGGRCVVSAIANYTTRLAHCDLVPFTDTATTATTVPAPADPADAPLSSLELRAESLRFLLHFVGDVAQPLPAAGRDRGGNDIKSHFGGKARNLHSIWDSAFLEKHIAQAYEGSKDALINAAIRDLAAAKTDPTSRFAQHLPRWSACFDQGRPVLDCAMQWAADSNQVACMVAFPLYDRLRKEAQEKGKDEDLDSVYYAAVRNGVEIALVGAGVHLAQILNRVLVKC
jgi:hypothetical protein